MYKTIVFVGIDDWIYTRQSRSPMENKKKFIDFGGGGGGGSLLTKTHTPPPNTHPHDGQGTPTRLMF